MSMCFLGAGLSGLVGKKLDNTPCQSMVDDQMMGYLYPVLFTKLFTELGLCTFTFYFCERDHWQQLDVNSYIDDQISQKSEAAQPNNFIDNLYEQEKDKFNTPGREPLRFAVLTDIHTDKKYLPGSKVKDCEKILCCRDDSGMATGSEQAAGKWGTADCDLPWRVFESSLSYIKDVIKPDGVFWLGDSVPHDLGDLTGDDIANQIKEIANEIQESLGGIKVYPILGNHDSFPMNNFSFSTPRANPVVNDYMSSF